MSRGDQGQRLSQGDLAFSMIDADGGQELARSRGILVANEQAVRLSDHEIGVAVAIHVGHGDPGDETSCRVADRRQ